jgi:hypothetical protein
MPDSRPRFQFTLLRLFSWVFAISIWLMLTTLPFPLNAYFAPLYCSCLFAYVGSQTVWRATVMGGLGCVLGIYATFAVGMSRGAELPMRPDPVDIPLVATCCCFPGGAHLGLIVGVLAREHRSEQRFKDKLAALCKETEERGARDLNSLRPGEPPKSGAEGQPD